MLRRLGAAAGDAQAAIDLAQRLAAPGAQLLVGRGEDAGLLLDTPAAPLLCSRRHAVLQAQDGRLLLSDLGSLNGTFVNEVRLAKGEPRALAEGDVLSFGAGRIMRQAGSEVDEPNPFVFQLSGLHLLPGAPAQPEAVQPLAPTQAPLPPPVAAPRQPQQEASSVVDLTADDSPVYPARRQPPAARTPSTATRSRKRAAPCIDLTVLDSDDDEILLPRFSAAVPPPPPKLPKLQEGASASAAEAQPSGSAAMVRAMEGQFECQICREFMVAAHSLVPCGHMFCGACVAEWIQKHESCPSCRARVTSAPVPCLAVDNMLDEVVAPHLDADAKAERGARKADWGARHKDVAASLAARFGGARGGPPAAGGVGGGMGPAALLPHIHLLGVPGFMEAAFASAPFPMPGGVGGGGGGGFASPSRPAGRRVRGRRSAAARGGAAAPPPGPPRPTTYSFTMPRRAYCTCDACSLPLLPGQPCITASSNSDRHYHTTCAEQVPAFLAAWRGSRGSLAGLHCLPSHELMRLRSLLT